MAITYLLFFYIYFYLLLLLLFCCCCIDIPLIVIIPTRCFFFLFYLLYFRITVGIRHAPTVVNRPHHYNTKSSNIIRTYLVVHDSFVHFLYLYFFLPHRKISAITIHISLCHNSPPPHHRQHPVHTLTGSLHC